MKALVTGATGFVGHALCERLRNAGTSVRRVVRSGRASSRKDDICIGDIAEADWTSALEGAGAVVHLAARTHVMRETAADPLAEYRRVNVLATERLASDAASAGVRRFIYLSSIKVNGEATFDRPFTENGKANPQDAYGISKWEAEQVLHRIARETGMEIVILRPPLVYGPRVKGNFLSLLKAVDRGWPLPLGSIQNKRSLIYVGSLADAIIRCISHPNAAGQTFLVSDGEDVSTPALIERVAKALCRPSRLVSSPPTLLNIAAKLIGRKEAAARFTGSLQVDSSKIRRELDWQPPYAMKDGLAATCDWYRESQAAVPLKH